MSTMSTKKRRTLTQITPLKCPTRTPSHHQTNSSVLHHPKTVGKSIYHHFQKREWNLKRNSTARRKLANYWMHILRNNTRSWVDCHGTTNDRNMVFSLCITTSISPVNPTNLVPQWESHPTFFRHNGNQTDRRWKSVSRGTINHKLRVQRSKHILMGRDERKMYRNVGPTFKCWDTPNRLLTHSAGISTTAQLTWLRTMKRRS